MINAEYFIARNRRKVGDDEILIRLAQEASRLACAALERPFYGDIRREHLAERKLAAAIGCMQAAIAIAVERFKFEGKAIKTAREKFGLKCAREIDPEWRCANDDVSRDAHSAGMAV